MSKYMPHNVVVREQWKHQLRLQNGLKVGTHVMYPDINTGPYIIKKELAEQLTSQRSAELKKEVD